MSKRCHLAKGTRQSHAGGGGFGDGKDAMKRYKVGKPKAGIISRGNLLPGKGGASTSIRKQSPRAWLVSVCGVS